MNVNHRNAQIYMLLFCFCHLMIKISSQTNGDETFRNNNNDNNRYNRNKFDRSKNNYKKKSSSIIQKENFFSSFISNKNNNNKPVSTLNRKFNLKNNFDDDSFNNNFRLDCPIECTCTGLSIDCSYRDLKQVPKNIPKEVIKV